MQSIESWGTEISLRPGIRMSSQMPQAGALTVDRIAHFVPDIGAAGAALEALGGAAIFEQPGSDVLRW